MWQVNASDVAIWSICLWCFLKWILVFVSVWCLVEWSWGRKLPALTKWLRPWCCSRWVSLAMPQCFPMPSWRASTTCPCLPSCPWCPWLVSLPPLQLLLSWSHKCSHHWSGKLLDSLIIGPSRPGSWPCPSPPSLWLLSTCWSPWMVSRRTSVRLASSWLCSRQMWNFVELHGPKVTGSLGSFGVPSTPHELSQTVSQTVSQRLP